MTPGTLLVAVGLIWILLLLGMLRLLRAMDETEGLASGSDAWPRESREPRRG